jgi:hypothetical protein
MRLAARQRAGHYSADRIMAQYLGDLGLPAGALADHCPVSPAAAPAAAPAPAADVEHRSVA